MYLLQVQIECRRRIEVQNCLFRLFYHFFSILFLPHEIHLLCCAELNNKKLHFSTSPNITFWSWLHTTLQSIPVTGTLTDDSTIFCCPVPYLQQCFPMAHVAFVVVVCVVTHGGRSFVRWLHAWQGQLFLLFLVRDTVCRSIVVRCCCDSGEGHTNIIVSKSKSELDEIKEWIKLGLIY